MKKAEYIDAAFDVVWTSISATLKELQVKGEIHVEYHGKKRKVLFLRQDQGLSVIITRDGDIEVCFDDGLSSYFWVRYAKYSEDEERQHEQINHFREDIKMIINDFCRDEVSWDSVIDYLNDLDDATGWMDAYKEARDDWF